MARVRQGKFTMLMCAMLLGIAASTSAVIYCKELASIELLNFSVGHPNSATAEEVRHLKKEALVSFLIFALPVFPLAGFFGRRLFQIGIFLASATVLALSIIASPGGDMKGCEDCLASMYFSLITSAASSTLLFALLLWSAITRLLSRRSS